MVTLLLTLPTRAVMGVVERVAVKLGAGLLPGQRLAVANGEWATVEMAMVKFHHQLRPGSVYGC